MPLRNKRTVVNFDRVRLAIGLDETDFRQVIELAVRAERDESAPFRRVTVPVEDWAEIGQQLAAAIAAGNAVKA